MTYKPILLTLIFVPLFTFIPHTAHGEVGGTITKTANESELIASSQAFRVGVNSLVLSVLSLFTWENEVGTIMFSDTGYSIDNGCNTLFGSIAIDGTRAVFGPTASTLMACDAKKMEADRVSTEAISKARNLTFKDGNLVIWGGGTMLTYSPHVK